MFHFENATQRNEVVLKRLAITIWTILIAIVCYKSIATPNLHSVFPLYYESAQWYWSGVERTTFDGDSCSRQYGPIFGHLMAPFAALPLSAGACIWYVASVAVFLTGSLAVFRNLSSGLSRTAVFAAFCILPLIGGGSLSNLQSNILFAGLLAWAAVSVERRHWWLASLCLAVPVAVKLYPIAFALVFLGLFPRPLIPRFAASLLLLAAIPFVFSGADFAIDSYREWYHYIADAERFANPGWENHDLRTLIGTWVHPLTVAEFLPLQIATGTLLFALVLHRKRRGATQRNVVSTSYRLASIWLILFGPASEHHTYMLAAPAAALMIVEAWSQRTSMARRVTLVLAYFTFGPLCTDILGRDARLWATSLEIAPAGLAVVAFWVVYDAMTSPERMAESIEMDRSEVAVAA